MINKILVSRCAPINNMQAPFQRIPVSSDTTSTCTTVHGNSTTDSVDRAFTKTSVKPPPNKQIVELLLCIDYLVYDCLNEMGMYCYALKNGHTLRLIVRARYCERL